MAVITVFPFAWMFLTSIMGPADAITSVPPQFLPNDPTLAAYARVWDTLPIANYFLELDDGGHRDGAAEHAGRGDGRLPCWPRWLRLEFVFYLLLATLIVLAQLTYIPELRPGGQHPRHYYDRHRR